MEERVKSNAILMQHIQQLEQERDELRLDVEQLCMQHSGMPSKVDISSQIQARRITGLEQEMELWKQKLQACIVKNQKLQDELTEVQQIKAHFADLLKSETDKNLELGKEIKFFQGEAATALVQRDQALLEVENCLEQEAKLIDKVHQLEGRLGLLTSNLLEQKKCFQILQEQANAAREESEKLHDVVQFFWKIRSELSDGEHAQNIQDKGAVLLQDGASSWAFGNTKQELERLSCQVKESGAAMAALQEEVCAAKESVIVLERQLEEEILSNQHAKQHSLLLEQKLLHLTEIIEGKLRSLRSVIAGLKEETMRRLKEEQSWADSMFAALISFVIQINSSSHTSELLTRPPDITEGLGDRDVSHDASGIQKDVTNNKILPQQADESEIAVTKEALAIALEEKVAALLLLSQQDERNICRENMIAAREKKIAELHKQLLKVTIDKGDALIQVANLTEELARIQGRCEPQHLSQYHDETGSNHYRKHNRKTTLLQWPSKSWVKGHNNMGFRSKAQTFLRTRVKDDSRIARSQTENAFSWSVLSNLQKLCSLVNHLHQALIKVRGALDGRTDTGFDESEELDLVICESQSLIVTVGGWLQATDANHMHAEIVEDAIGMGFRASGCQGAAVDLLLTFGRTSIEAILLVAEICKSCLSRLASLNVAESSRSHPREFPTPSTERSL
ncbi:hypothetical protein GOP47_0028183 [Adiantum capillus-veneris]|nr:hypothetical protein GOP47_0028183 [Adiantum capillus-veneris]